MVEVKIQSRAWLPCVMAILLLSACASRQEAPEPPFDLPEAFTRSGDPSAASAAWWQAFADPQLNTLVEQAMDGNLSLRAGYQRLQQARAVADRQRAGLFPSLDAGAGVERQETDDMESETFNAGLSAAYEIDLWGRVRSLSQAEALRTSAALQDYQAAAVSLSGEIARVWFQLVEQRAQYALAESQLEINRNVLTVIESRFASGQSGGADVLRQRQLVSTSRERLTGIEGEIGVLENQLAVLIGQLPGHSELPESTALPALPPLPETGVPAELIQRRPDLKRAWSLIHAADRELAAAIRNRFPRLSIEASINSRANDTEALFDDWLTTLAGNLVLPLIDGGQRRADVRRARAAREELVHDYGQAVLVAIREVEDALVREQQQSRRLQSLDDRIRLADATYRQLRNQYLNGAVSYIEVLTALQDKQDYQRARLTAEQQLLNSRVALYRALAGGIEPALPEAEATDSTENNEA